MYALLRQKRDSAQRCRGYTLYGVCGNRRLLERVRAGQEAPEQWRIIRAINGLALPKPRPLRKAG